MESKKRLDWYLKEKGFFESREKAQLAIRRGVVAVNSRIVQKSSFEVSEIDTIEVLEKALQFVSIGGEKLFKAIQTFKIELEHQLVLDVGASTGGFTDCCLQQGAKKVYAVDVGQDQLHHTLRNDERVICYENKNIKDLTLEDLHHQVVDWIVMDVSFTSVTKILPDVLTFLKPKGQLLVLVKPQFEQIEKKRQKGGIIKDPKVHQQILRSTQKFFQTLSLTILGVVETDIEDEHKNLEFLCWLQN